ncbi:hypothetical protein PHYBOEH_009730 [Phytophthora boehmeriae]|uniref:M96 mating-specific protein family n=1 Tax=Phytophthora boehmeriae TaxID=109152 RepID=A0A8T1VVB0_9STRA|nr:hypothetical protein PHYBOEH_009730 [Phytophthora boehmeriae]
MEEDGLAMPMEFLQELDFWLEGGGVPSLAAQTRSTGTDGENAGLLGFQNPILTPVEALTETSKSDTGSFVSSLLESAQSYTEPSTGSLDGSSSSPTSSSPQKRLTRQNTAKKSVGRPKKAAAAASVQEPLKKKSKTNKSTSQRQKEELAYLRNKTQQLETELDALKQRSRDELERQQMNQKQAQNEEIPEDTMEVSTSLVTRTASSVQQEVSLWERIAKRQREEKAKSEVENVKLREMVQSQMRLVKSFERLLRKRRIWDQLQESSNHLDNVEGQNEDQMLEEMLFDVNARYPRVDTILKEHGLGETDPAVDVGDDATMKYSATDGMYLEFREKKFMPFSYKTMDRVVWQSLIEGKLKIEDTEVVILKTADDMIFSKVSLPLPRSGPTTNDSKGPGTTEMYTAMRRFQEDNRVVYVWSASMNVLHPQDGSRSPALLVQKGCSSASTATLPDGSPGCSVRSYTSSVPTLSNELPQENSEEEQAQYREVGLLTEMVFAAYQQSRQSITQTLENLLLDEMMARNTSMTPVTSTAQTDCSS